MLTFFDVAVFLFEEVYRTENVWRNIKFFVILARDDIDAFVVFAFAQCISFI